MVIIVTTETHVFAVTYPESTTSSKFSPWFVETIVLFSNNVHTVIHQLL